MDDIKALIIRQPCAQSRIHPYLGGKEINDSPTYESKRFVINLSDIREEADLESCGELLDIIRTKVKPERDAPGDNPNNRPIKRRWWAFHANRHDFYKKIKSMGKMLCMSQVSSHIALAFQKSDRIIGHTVNP